MKVVTAPWAPSGTYASQQHTHYGEQATHSRILMITRVTLDTLHTRPYNINKCHYNSGNSTYPIAYSIDDMGSCSKL